jgi:Fe-Mn family superoxide dismutase
MATISRKKSTGGPRTLLLPPTTEGASMATAATNFSRLNLPPLPYSVDALEPVISAKTLSFHHGKHHNAYVENTNKLIVGTELADLPLDQIVTATVGKAGRESIFNNAAQAWNHGFYWHCLTPRGGGQPPTALKNKMESAFGSVDACKKELANSAVAQFGSGWAWLALEGSNLKVVKTANADTPFARGLTPLLAIDVWEHAYYLDYQNKRVDHVNAVIDKLMNWQFAAGNLESFEANMYG